MMKVLQTIGRLRQLTIYFTLFSVLVATTFAAQGAAPTTNETARRMLDSFGERCGLCLHLGFRDAELTMQLSDDGRYLVHGVCRDVQVVEEGRKQIRRRGLGGAVSLEHHPLDRLPHADNLANLLVAEDVASSLDGGRLLDEIVRVLRPGGTALVVKTALDEGAMDEKELKQYLAKANVQHVEKKTIGSSVWFVFEKPRPSNMDQWTHRRYDASRNAVSQDQVSVPSGVRWMAGPNWPTGNRKRAVPAVVASKDRLVYVFDDLLKTEKGYRHQNMLVARDGFNGILLWQRKTGNEGSPILIHVGERVYTVVEDDGPLVALDAATGEVVQTYDEVGEPEEAYHVDGRLLVCPRSGVCCLEAKTGKLLWEHDAAVLEMVAGDRCVYVQGRFRNEDGERITGITALDLTSGRTLWRSDSDRWPRQARDAELILYQDGILVFADDGNHAVSAKDGKYLWSYEYPTIGHGGSHRKVVYMDDLLWIHSAKSEGPDGKDSYAWEGLDPQTGKTLKRLPHGRFKHRCMSDVATGRFIVCGSMDFVGLKSQKHTHFTATRVSCSSGGVIPANGLVYTFPHACGCYPMLRGFLGLAAEQDDVVPETGMPRHERGPAWPAQHSQPPKTDEAWTMYRANPQRSGSTSQRVPGRLKVRWSSQLSDVEAAAMRRQWDMKDFPRLTSATVSEGMVFAAVSDTHELYALNADSGETQWVFTAGGRIDCPPTLYRGLCLFGARDGYAYCLRASDGQLVWRYRAAPHPRRIVAYGQLESAWPVVGGVLIHDDLAYFVAGRHGAADGGVHIYAAQPASGEIVWHSNPKDFSTVPDVLVAREGAIHMANWQFDTKSGENREGSSDVTLSSARLGMLNDAWYERPIALRKNLQHWQAHDISAQMLAFDDKRIAGFEGVSKVSGGDGKISGNAELFVKPLGDDGRGWSSKHPLGTQLKGMAVAGDTLLVAGRLDGFDEDSHGLRVVSLSSGKSLGEVRLSEPLVHDCLSVAGGHVYLATERGRILCLSEQ